MVETLLQSLGIGMPELFASFSGGIVAALVTAGARPNIWSIFSSIVVGTLTGIYVGPMVPGLAPWLGIKAGPGTAFGAAVGGMPISRLIISAAQRFTPPRPAAGEQPHV